MHQLIVALLFALFATSAAAAPPPCAALYVKGRELWIAENGEGRFLHRDEMGVELPHWSPDGRRIAYVREMESVGRRRTDVVVLNARELTTKVVATLTVEDPVKAVEQVGWHGNEAVWIEGHVNPSTGIYYEWNVRNGELVRETPGSRFTWSPDGRHLAYTEHRVHFSPDALRPAGLVIDEEVVWKPAGGERVRSGLAWSASSDAVAFVISTEKESALKVVDRAARRERSSIPVDTQAAPRVRWDPAHPERVLIESTHSESIQLDSRKRIRLGVVAESVIRDGDETYRVSDSGCP